MLIYKFDENCVKMDNVPRDKPVCIILGGYKTFYSRILLKEYAPAYNFIYSCNKNLSVYGGTYPLNHKINYLRLRSKKIENLMLISQLFNLTTYTDSVLNNVVLPRLQSQDGKKLSPEQAMHNMRNLMFFAHSYGGILADILDKKITHNMKKIGYSDEECNQIQKQTVIITLAPTYLLCKQKATVLNFVSASDNTILYGKMFPCSKRIQFVQDYNLVLSPNIFTDFQEIRKQTNKDIEHRIWFYGINDMSDTGYDTINLLKNVMINTNNLDKISDTKSLLKVDNEKDSARFETITMGNNTRYTTIRMIIKSCLNRIASNTISKNK